MRFVTLIALVAAIAACDATTEETYQKADMSSRKEDIDACQIVSLQQVPRAVNPITGSDPDLNLRVRLFDQCMASKGYTVSR